MLAPCACQHKQLAGVLHFWAWVLMPFAPKTFRPTWLQSHSELPRFSKHQTERRGSARERGYDTQWQKARAGYFKSHPLCVCCQAHGVVVAASVLDHVEPHKGDRAKFWDSANWQGLCDWCDKNLKRVVENRWLKGRAAAHELRLDRVTPGWEHPRDR